MKNLIYDNPITCLVALIIVVCVLVMIFRSRKGLLVKAALYAVSRAEETWGSNTGKIKFAEAYTYITKQYPIVTFFFSEEQLSNIIEEALSQMKQILATKEAKLQKEKEETERMIEQAAA